MWLIWVTGEVLTGFRLGDLGERDHLEDLGVYWRIILKCNLKKWDGGLGLDLWLRIGTGGRRL